MPRAPILCAVAELICFFIGCCAYVLYVACSCETDSITVWLHLYKSIDSVWYSCGDDSNWSTVDVDH